MARVNYIKQQVDSDDYCTRDLGRGLLRDITAKRSGCKWSSGLCSNTVRHSIAHCAKHYCAPYLQRENCRLHSAGHEPGGPQQHGFKSGGLPYSGPIRT